MKVEVKENVSEIKFPRLMKDKNGELVVFFIDDKQGICVVSDGFYNVGNYLDHWFIECFEPFNGTITLEND